MIDNLLDNLNRFITYLFDEGYIWAFPAIVVLMLWFAFFR